MRFDIRRSFFADHPNRIAGRHSQRSPPKVDGRTRYPQRVGGGRCAFLVTRHPNVALKGEADAAGIKSRWDFSEWNYLQASRGHSRVSSSDSRFPEDFETSQDMRPSGRDGLDELRAFFLHFVNDGELDRFTFLLELVSQARITSAFNSGRNSCRHFNTSRRGGSISSTSPLSATCPRGIRSSRKRPLSIRIPASYRTRISG